MVAIENFELLKISHYFVSISNVFVTSEIKKNFNFASISTYFTKITKLIKLTFHRVSRWNNVILDSISKRNKNNFIQIHGEIQNPLKFYTFHGETEMK